MNIISRKDAKEQGLKYYFTGKECINGHISKRRTVKADCLQCIRDRDLKSYKENPSKFKERQRAFYKENKVRIIERSLKYQRKNNSKRSKRISSDPFLCMARRARSRIQKAFLRGGFSKKSKTHEMLGCSWGEFFIHIEKQFEKGMSWNNKEKWHIDHIIPLASAKTEKEMISLMHFSNLRPLWANENISKSSKMEFLI